MLLEIETFYVLSRTVCSAQTSPSMPFQKPEHQTEYRRVVPLSDNDLEKPTTPEIKASGLRKTANVAFEVGPFEARRCTDLSRDTALLPLFVGPALAPALLHGDFVNSR